MATDANGVILKQGDKVKFVGTNGESTYVIDRIVVQPNLECEVVLTGTGKPVKGSQLIKIK